MTDSPAPRAVGKTLDINVPHVSIGRSVTVGTDYLFGSQYWISRYYARFPFSLAIITHKSSIVNLIAAVFTMP